MNGLKPCPCGGFPMLHVREIAMYVTTASAIRQNCHRRVDVDSDSPDGVLKRVITKWNQRMEDDNA